jgi:exodeoxyribonuclease VII large subunit
MASPTEDRKVLSVAQVNRLVSGMLHEHFPDVWLEGEVSNFKAYSSGHLYFTLKDESSQISAVCFRTSAQALRFELRDGMQVVGHGRVELYVPSGKYQIILEYMEPKGKGALQEAFEQLKKRLAEEGLFSEARKKSMPVLPGTVAVVTSPSGAVIHDILRTLRLHDARVRVLVYPVAVQGEDAGRQIAEAMQDLNAREDVDVIIVARGGGSLEDLWAFNEEVVARAIAGSRIPVISGVGHETDFTISDFVADVRAATPTAAAQLIAQGREEFAQRLKAGADGLVDAAQEFMFNQEQRLDELIRHRAFDVIRTGLAEQQSRVFRLASRIEGLVRDFRHRTDLRVRTLAERMARSADARFRTGSSRLGTAAAKLDMLSPLASLSRGYAICRKADGSVVTRVAQVTQGEDVSLRVTDGLLECEVTEKKADSVQ